SFLGGNGFEEIFTVRRPGSDSRTLARWIARIQNKNWNILLDRGQDGGWMQDFRSEISKFGGFIEANDFDSASVWAQIRVGGHHAVDISPDFDSIGAQSRANDRCRKIGAPAPDRCSDPVASCADEAAHHRNMALFGQRPH